MFTFDFPLILNQSSNQVKNILCSSVFRYVFSSDLSPLHKGMKKEKKIRTKQEQKTISFVTPVAWSKSESQFWMSKSKPLKSNNWNWEFKNVSRTLNFSSRVYEKILRYTLNLQMLIWKKLLRGQEGVAIQWSNKIPLVNASIYHGGGWLTSSCGFEKFFIEISSSL